MNVGIIFMIIASIVIILHFLFRKINNKPIEVFQGKGIIDNITHTDSGSVNYYVPICHEGRELRGKSRTYPSIAPPKNIGESVEFDYFLMNEKKARIIIHDDYYVNPAEKHTSNTALVIGIILFIVGIVLSVVCSMV